MSERDETRLRELFSELRRENARDAPPFDRTWESARRQRDAPPPGGWALPAVGPVPLAAAALTILLVVLVSWPSTSPPDFLLETEITVADWTSSSTDFLALDNVGFLELGVDERLAAAGEYDDWSLPSDDLLEQAESTFGQEREL